MRKHRKKILIKIELLCERLSFLKEQIADVDDQ